MTDTNISSITGLPELPEGQYWHVGQSGDFELPTMRVEVRKRLQFKAYRAETSEKQYPTVLDALQSRAYRMDVGVLVPWSLPGHRLGGGVSPEPDLWSDDIELVDKKTEVIEHFTPKKFLRKPKLDWTEYKYSATVLWDGFEVLFGGHTSDFSEQGILDEAMYVLEEAKEKREVDAFVAKVSGSYPPKKLEVG